MCCLLMWLFRMLSGAIPSTWALALALAFIRPWIGCECPCYGTIEIVVVIVIIMAFLI